MGRFDSSSTGKSAGLALPKIAIIAALERELEPLIRTWRKSKFMHGGREFTSYDTNNAVAICGGIGAECGRRAAEAAVVKYSPEILISAGIAGAAVPELHVGDTVFPAVVVDTGDGSRHQTAIHHAALSHQALPPRVLASYPRIAGSAEKRQLQKSYGAHLVDMEGASVARAAEVHGLEFLAVKAVSDEVNFEIAGLNRFVRAGQMATGPLVLYIMPRPWLWPKMIRLARNTRLASRNLCARLRESALAHTMVPGARGGTLENGRARKA
jgi:adenosylhomocysteine nucleosidase